MKNLLPKLPSIFIPRNKDEYKCEHKNAICIGNEDFFDVYECKKCGKVFHKDKE